MAGVCVGPGFVVNSDGSLGLNGPRSGTWPYTGASCGIAQANGLRLDASAGLWVEPPDLRQPFSFPGSNSTSLSLTTSPQSLNIGGTTFPNADVCRPALLSGAISVTFTVSVQAGHTANVIGTTYLGSPPSSSGQPTLWSTQNNGIVTATYTHTLTLPYSYSLTAGQTGAVLGAALWATADASSVASLNGISWSANGTAMTSRTTW